MIRGRDGTWEEGPAGPRSWRHFFARIVTTAPSAMISLRPSVTTATAPLATPRPSGDGQAPPDGPYRHAALTELREGLDVLDGRLDDLAQRPLGVPADGMVGDTGPDVPGVAALHGVTRPGDGAGGAWRARAAPGRGSGSSSAAWRRERLHVALPGMGALDGAGPNPGEATGACGGARLGAGLGVTGGDGLGGFHDGGVPTYGCVGKGPSRSPRRIGGGALMLGPLVPARGNQNEGSPPTEGSEGFHDEVHRQPARASQHIASAFGDRQPLSRVQARTLA